MKKLLPLILPLLLVSCGYSSVETPMLELEPGISTIQEARAWVLNNIRYVRDIDSQRVPDYWQTPEETLELGTGDCEDRTLLFMYLCNKHLGKKPELLVWRYLNFNANGSPAGHANAFWEMYIYDIDGVHWTVPEQNRILVRTMSYEYAMYFAEEERSHRGLGYGD